MESKYAIVYNSIEQCDFNLNLSSYIVSVGNSKGRMLSQYIHGRVDKACGRYDIIRSPKSITLLDFDERIVNNAVNSSKEYILGRTKENLHYAV